MQTFDKYAYTYQKHNIIQKKIIQKYLPLLKNRIVDLGCGSEGLCKYKNFDFYLGVDKSEKMLKLNPCNTIMEDFNKKSCFEKIKEYDFNQIVSFSALQWADDLHFTINEIEKLNKSFILSLFTSNTFKTLHSFLGVKSPIKPKEEILKAFKNKIYNIQTLHYTLYFKTPKDMLHYIKFSGVGKPLGAKPSKLKKFIKTFPFNHLEFEIITIIK